MALDPQQHFASHILRKVLPTAGRSPAARNLEWNAKKFLGQVPGQSIDASAYAEQTKADLAQLSSPAAKEAMAQIDAPFGLDAADTPEAAVDSYIDQWKERPGAELQPPEVILPSRSDEYAAAFQAWKVAEKGAERVD